jgi:predicted NBD/HSP70 family sugar kinase
MMFKGMITPKILPPLDTGFLPVVLANHAFQHDLGREGIPAALCLERNHGNITRFELTLFPEGHPRFTDNFPYVERILKFLLWQRGGHTVSVGGPEAMTEHLRRVYSANGSRSFDYHFLGTRVYDQPLRISHLHMDDMPAACESGNQLGRHLDGCRVGFDLGATDRKVCAVKDGAVVYSEEVPWQPRRATDPEYHYSEIMGAIHRAAGSLPRLDAVGGSAAGIYINNQPRVASLFRGVPPEKAGEVRNLFLRMQRELGVPLEVLNDGDVTALAGSMSLGENRVLGIAMGSSEAAGYVNREGLIMGWLNELSFAPIDLNPEAPLDEWSGDRGCGASYLSQQCVFRLAPAAGIEIPASLSDAERLQFVQVKLKAGHPGAEKIWQSMGVCLGYAIALYADFYDIRHVLILGRVTSGRGGAFLLDWAAKVLISEFPELMERIALHMPDETIRRIGQAVAAASLPVI